MNKNFKEPATFAVYCTVDGLTHRVGPADTLEAAHQRIVQDKAAMKSTFGGLIDAPGPQGRLYRIFKAEWEEV